MDLPVLVEITHGSSREEPFNLWEAETKTFELDKPENVVRIYVS